DEWNTAFIQSSYIGMWEIRAYVAALRAIRLVLDSAVTRANLTKMSYGRCARTVIAVAWPLAPVQIRKLRLIWFNVRLHARPPCCRWLPADGQKGASFRIP